MSDPSFNQAWLKCEEPIELHAESDEVKSQIWFKSEPLDRNFVNRVAHIQLCTDSHDQGPVKDLRHDGESYFEIVILPHDGATEPKVGKFDTKMKWKSHGNQRRQGEETRHYGLTFDRRHKLLRSLSVGDVLAVRAVAGVQGWINFASKAYLTARVLAQGVCAARVPLHLQCADLIPPKDLFPQPQWTLTSAAVPSFSEKILDGAYTFAPTSMCSVEAADATLAAQVWFTTPKLDQKTINQLESLQLFTHSSFKHPDTVKEPIPAGDTFSWFDIAILSDPAAEKPKVVNGVSMVWVSHINNKYERETVAGQLFDIDDDDLVQSDKIKQIKNSLEVCMLHWLDSI